MKSRSSLAAALAVVVLSGLRAGTAPDGTAPENPYRLETTTKLVQIVGDFDRHRNVPVRGRTASRYGVEGTDLGCPVEHAGRLWFLFGDTHPTSSVDFDPQHDDSIAFTTAARPEDFELTFLTKDAAPGEWKPPRISCPGEPNCLPLDGFNVPVAGISDGDTLFVWFTVDHAGRSILARSDDDARSFELVYELGRSHFIDLAAVQIEGPIPGIAGSEEQDWVLLFGSGTVDHPDVYAAAAPLESLHAGDRNAVWFLSGVEPVGRTVRLEWSRRERDSVPLFKIEPEETFHRTLVAELTGYAFGEPLVHFNANAGLWMATYNTGARRIRLRTARHWYGPWSESIVLFDPAVDYGNGAAFGSFIVGGDPSLPPEQWGAVYGPFVLPQFTEGPDSTGRLTLYHLLSTLEPYTVVVMKATLVPAR